MLTFSNSKIDFVKIPKVLRFTKIILQHKIWIIYLLGCFIKHNYITIKTVIFFRFIYVIQEIPNIWGIKRFKIFFKEFQRWIQIKTQYKVYIIERALGYTNFFEKTSFASNNNVFSF